MRLSWQQIGSTLEENKCKANNRILSKRALYNFRAAPVAQRLSAACSPWCDPGDPGSSPTSGSLRGAYFSLCLCLCLSLSASLWINKIFKNNSNYNFRFFNVFFSFCFTMSITSVFRKDLYTLLSPALPPVKSLDIVLWRLPGRSGWQSHQGNHYLFRICNQHGVPWNLKNFEKKKKHNETAYEQINTIISYNLRLTTVFNYMFLKSGSRNLQLSFEISISQHLL